MDLLAEVPDEPPVDARDGLRSPRRVEQLAAEPAPGGGRDDHLAAHRAGAALGLEPDGLELLDFGLKVVGVELVVRNLEVVAGHGTASWDGIGDSARADNAAWTGAGVTGGGVRSLESGYAGSSQGSWRIAGREC